MTARQILSHILIRTIHRCPQRNHMLLRECERRSSQCGTESRRSCLKRTDAEIPPQVPDLLMPFVNQVIRRHTGRIRIVDQDGIERHVLLPVIDHNKRNGQTADQRSVFVQHLRSQKDHARGLVILHPPELLLIVGVPAVKIAQHHLHPAAAALLLHAGDHHLEKWSVLHDHSISLIDDEFHLADVAFRIISKPFCRFKHTLRRPGIDTLFMIQRIGNSSNRYSHFFADIFQTDLHDGLPSRYPYTSSNTTSSPCRYARTLSSIGS